MGKYIVTDIWNAAGWNVEGLGFGSGRLIAERYLVQDIGSLKCLSLGYDDVMRLYVQGELQNVFCVDGMLWCNGWCVSEYKQCDDYSYIIYMVSKAVDESGWLDLSYDVSPSLGRDYSWVVRASNFCLVKDYGDDVFGLHFRLDRVNKGVLVYFYKRKIAGCVTSVGDSMAIDCDVWSNISKIVAKSVLLRQ